MVSGANTLKKFLSSLILICALAGGDCNAQWSRVDKDTIRLNGGIDRDSYESYLAAAAGGYTKVILRSEGGSPLPALLIARDMRKHRPIISVESHCLSACANYLFLASPAPHVQCGAIIMWHGSPSSTFGRAVQTMRVEGKSPQLIEKYEAWASSFEAMERDFFASIKVNRKLLLDSVEIVRRERIVPEATFTFDEMTGDYSESRSSGLWIPTLGVIRGYGVATRNFCTSYDADIPRALARLGISAPYTSAGPLK